LPFILRSFGSGPTPLACKRIPAPQKGDACQMTVERRPAD
jgi:hypothetical protein